MESQSSPLPLFDEDSGRLPVVLRQIVPNGFVLSNVFSPMECRFYIGEFDRRAAEGEPESLDWSRQQNGAQQTYRRVDRIAARSPEFAALLWRRIAPHLPDLSVDVNDSVVAEAPVYAGGCFTRGMYRGRWQPLELNDLIRFCKYNPGGLFGAHRDGIYIRSDTQRSMYTVMLYLNSDFEGGETNFLHGADEEHVQGVSYSLKPEAGSCLVFLQDLLHEGLPLLSGLKYMLRTDLVFECRSPSKPTSDREDEARHLITLAQEYERCGNGMAAVEAYSKAFKLCPHLEQSMGF
eukprot:TRINITY_DN30746_c0_g1_i1.p1 TRINITY_DN30746_c0_g1~~TRINITY_DN30746_c0_g1_i1.p1  ORF type:complete len:292 (+),score=62.25 TRINITY_DN30746_c0_g1_i1:295-1170(+)